MEFEIAGRVVSVSEFVEYRIEQSRPFDSPAAGTIIATLASLVEVMAEKGLLSHDDVIRITG